MARSLRRVRLVELEHRYLGTLARIVSKPQVGRYWDTRGEEIDEHSLAELLFGSQIFQTVVERYPDGPVVGYCGLGDVSVPDLHGSMSLFMDDSTWGSGFALEVLVGYVDLVFARTPLRKLYFPMHEQTVARQRGVDRFLNVEARFKNHVCIDGTWSDLVVAALDRDRFATMLERDRFVRRLLPLSEMEGTGQVVQSA